MTQSFTTVNGSFEITTVIERSKFICYIKGVNDEDEAKEFVSQIKKMHSLATHNCYAYIADEKGLIQKFSDDGEPQGTAGLPMLDVLKNRKIYKTVAVVTRYFGGIKLGTGGLVRAYGGAVNDCLNACDIVTFYSADFAVLTLDYEQYSKFLNLTFTDVKVVNTEFEQSVNVKVAVKFGNYDNFIQKISDLFSGKITPVKTGSGYFGF